MILRLGLSDVVILTICSRSEKMDEKVIIADGHEAVEMEEREVEEDQKRPTT